MAIHIAHADCFTQMGIREVKQSLYEVTAQILAEMNEVRL